MGRFLSVALACAGVISACGRDKRGGGVDLSLQDGFLDSDVDDTVVVTDSFGDSSSDSFVDLDGDISDETDAGLDTETSPQNDRDTETESATISDGCGFCIDSTGRQYKTIRIRNLCWTKEDMALITQDSKSIPRARAYPFITGCKICPTGWRLPHISAWDELGRHVSKEDLAPGGATGLDLEMSGYWHTDFGDMLDDMTCWWSHRDYEIECRGLVTERIRFTGDAISAVNCCYQHLCAVRCVKDPMLGVDPYADIEEYVARCDPTDGACWQDPPKKWLSRQNGIDYCDSLVLQGYDDWRLPTSEELLAMVRDTRTDEGCLWDNSWTGDCKEPFWSISLDENMDGLVVDFQNGTLDGRVTGDHYFVRCLRGEIERDAGPDADL